jgi:two-component system cell cycle sensor histidine kinase PleC
MIACWEGLSGTDVDVAIAAALSRNATAEAKDRLVLDQLRIALQNLKPNHFLMPTFGAIMCLMFARWIDVRWLAIWYTALIAGVIPLAIVSQRFLRAELHNDARVKWVRSATVSYVVFTLVWSAQGIFLWAPGNDLNHMLIMLILCCTLAGNGALIGASAPISIAAYVVYGTAIVLIPFQASGLVYRGLSAMAFFYAVYMAWMSKQYFDTARSMLLLRNDKNDLISALAESKEQSDVARHRAENASRAKSQFLANMSHELRTPLNAILGFSELIQSRIFSKDVERHIEYAGLIHSSGTHLLTLINDILDLAKIEAGGLVLRERDIDLVLLVQDCGRLMSAKAEEAKLVFETSIANDLPQLRGDERALKQVLLNLLSNALKFTPQNGRVVLFAFQEASGEFCIGVEDNGVGIEPQDQQRVFENFGQGRHDVVTRDKGTGLGLPIVKGLVEAHGGRVLLESTPGIGTKVAIFLPADRALPRAVLRAAS